MLLSFVLLSGLSVGDGHEKWHSAEVDYYFEVPDLQATEEAYRSAPVRRLLADEAIAGFLSSLGLDMSFDADLGLADALEAGFDLARTPDALRVVLRQVVGAGGRLSVSLAGLDEDREALTRDAEAVAEALREIRALESAVEAASSAPGGAPPASLDELDLSDEARMDPWGRPYLIGPADEGGAPAPRSLGRDGREGGAFVDADLSPQTDRSTSWMEIQLSRARVAVICEFAEDSDATALVEALDGLGSLAIRADSDRNDGGIRSRVYDVDDLSGFGLWMARWANTVAVGLASRADLEVEALRARVASGAGSLGESPSFREGFGQMGEPGGTTVLNAFKAMPFFELFARLASLEPGGGGDGEMGDLMSGLSSFVSGSDRAPTLWRTSLVDGAFETSTFIAMPTTVDGMDRWMGRSSLDSAAGPSVPADAMMVYTTSLDGEELGRVFLEWMAEQSGVGAQDWIGALEAEYGFKADRDLFGNLGSRLLVWSRPLEGVGPPKMYAYVDLEDAETFWSAFESCVDFLGKELGDELEVKQRPYHKIPIISLDLDIHSMFQPAFAVLDGRLVVGLNSTHIKREIKRWEKAEETGAHEALASLGEGELAPSSLYFMDWPVFVDGVLGLAQSLGPLIGGAADLPFDLTSLPSAESVTQYLAPSRSEGRVVKGGRIIHEVSSFGPELPVMLGLGVFGFVAEEGGGPEPMVVGPDSAQSVGEPAVDDELLIGRTRSTMRDLRGGLTVFRLENGGYPSLLEDLVKPTESYPRGFLDEMEVPVDAWGRAFSYEPAADGRSFELWSSGPDGVDQRGAGDDVSAP